MQTTSLLQSQCDQAISSDLSDSVPEEERNYFEQESEQGDNSYLVQTDLAGQVSCGQWTVIR